jgi:hypothetical protein
MGTPVRTHALHQTGIPCARRHGRRRCDASRALAVQRDAALLALAAFMPTLAEPVPLVTVLSPPVPLVLLVLAVLDVVSDAPVVWSRRWHAPSDAATMTATTVICEILRTFMRNSS